MEAMIAGLEELNFVKLDEAVLCANCEVISNETHAGCCSACGSRALMSVSRLLGGTVLPETSFPNNHQHYKLEDYFPELDIELMPVY
jgi:hypothetical protein